MSSVKRFTGRKYSEVIQETKQASYTVKEGKGGGTYTGRRQGIRSRRDICNTCRCSG
ncbi:MAG: hypothetical protein HY739_06735 [Desulfobacterales bacterium]|nr:hypothetical protein [Desulfobacterales bacterium]